MAAARSAGTQQQRVRASNAAGVPAPPATQGPACGTATQPKCRLAKGSTRDSVPPRGVLHGGHQRRNSAYFLSRQAAKDNVLPVLRPQRGVRQQGKRCPVPRDELSPQSRSLNHPTCRKGSL